MSAAAGSTNLLKGGSTTVTATVGNAAGSSVDTMDWNVDNHSTTGLTISGSGSAPGAGRTTSVAGAYTGSSLRPANGHR